MRNALCNDPPGQAVRGECDQLHVEGGGGAPQCGAAFVENGGVGGFPGPPWPGVDA